MSLGTQQGEDGGKTNSEGGPWGTETMVNLILQEIFGKASISQLGMNLSKIPWETKELAVLASISDSKSLHPLFNRPVWNRLLCI